VPAEAPRRLDRAALARAGAFLHSRSTIVRSGELEAVTGLSRYELARQFRALYGTSPYRYSVMRRLDLARSRLRGGTRLADLALTAGFADQAHFTRAALMIVAIKGLSLPTVAGFQPEVADRVFRQFERLLGLPTSDSQPG
jgi:AraC-like DNA-binding protein